MATLKAVIADDDPLVRRVIRETLELASVEVVAEARTGLQAVERTLALRPDALVLDLCMPEGDGLEVIRRLRTELGEGVKIVVMSGTCDEARALAVLLAGADGFLGKDAPLAALPRALRAVSDGEIAISRGMTKALVERLRWLADAGAGPRPAQSALTTRQWQVLDLLCQGASTERIAATLVLSDLTVRSHIKQILRRLGVHSRREAVAKAETLRLQPAP
jgi:DNA-binding NarL/FixJ family response regulator